MQLIRKIYPLFAVLLLFGLAACVPGAQPAADAPARAVESHLQALAARDEDTFSLSLCSEWEPQAFLEYDAYLGVKAELKDLACSSDAVQADEAQVTCQGSLQLSYGKENQQVDLSRRAYRVTGSGGNWQVCGYSEQVAGLAGSR